MLYGSSPHLVYSFICQQRINKQGVTRADKTNRNYIVLDGKMNILDFTDIMHRRRDKKRTRQGRLGCVSSFLDAFRQMQR